MKPVFWMGSSKGDLIAFPDEVRREIGHQLEHVQAIQVNTGEVMKTKKVMRERDEHGPRHVTPAGRSVFYDLFPKAEADELVMRSTLLRGLEQWLKESGLTQTQAAKLLGITQARVSDIKRGKFSQFSLDMLVRLASRAGLKPRLKLAA
jgi:predicted XRE-type DNA-binding protein